MVIQVPGVANATAEVAFGERTGPITDGELAVELAGIESRVCRVKGIYK